MEISDPDMDISDPDMEISDPEPTVTRKKTVTHDLDSEDDVIKASLTADKDQDLADADSDLSDLSDLDDDEFNDIEEDLIVGRGRPEIDIDQDAVRKMGVHRRARGDGPGDQKRKKEVSRRVRKSKEE